MDGSLQAWSSDLSLPRHYLEGRRTRSVVERNCFKRWGSSLLLCCRDMIVVVTPCVQFCLMSYDNKNKQEFY